MKTLLGGNLQARLTATPPKYKAVFFDAGNTLLKPYPSVEQVCAEVLHARGHTFALDDVARALETAERFYEDRYWSDDTFWHSEPGARSLWEAFYAVALERLGIREPSQLATLIYDEFGYGARWSLYPDVFPTLQALAERGLKLGLISNWDGRLRDICFELGIFRQLDFIVCSAVVGRAKPQPEIFEIALRRAGVRAHEAMHVGDHYYADFMGARSAGLTAVLIDRGECRAPCDWLMIKDLTELIAIVDAAVRLPS